MRDEDKSKEQLIADIHELRQRLAESEKDKLERKQTDERFRTLTDLAPAGIYFCDTKGACKYANPHWCEVSGLTLEEALGDGWVKGLHPEDRASILSNWQLMVESEGRWGLEYRFQTPDGKVTWVHGLATPQRDSQGTIVGYVGINTDITDRKLAEKEKENLQARLLQAQKAESLGRMAGAIAHHFNNMLGAVIGNLELALDDLPQGLQTREFIVKSMKASHQAAETSRLMLAYLGQTIGRREPLDLAEAIRETLPLLRSSVPKNVRMKTDIPPQGPIILGDAVHLKQILTNMLSNAVEAMGDNEGDVTVTTQVTLAEDIPKLQLLPLDWEPIAAPYACLSVADTGCGMDGATLEKIFDPFFSTKFMGRGLGLAVVLGLVRAHDGAIAVECQPDRGTVFRVFLPLHTQSLSSLKADSIDVKPAEAGGLVLVVDDEAMVRNMAESMLKRKFGYEVVTACDGSEAVEIFRVRMDEIDLVLLDLSMPGMSGWETLAALRALRPDTHVILASGYDEAAAMQSDHQERPQAFLHKPYGAKDLKAALAMVLKIH